VTAVSAKELTASAYSRQYGLQINRVGFGPNAGSDSRVGYDRGWIAPDRRRPGKLRRISTRKSASVRLGRRGLLKTHLPEPDLDEAANGRAAY